MGFINQLRTGGGILWKRGESSQQLIVSGFLFQDHSYRFILELLNDLLSESKLDGYFTICFNFWFKIGESNKTYHMYILMTGNDF